ncbi:MAG: motility protein A [Clostridiales bacterium]|nr:motility protein A [Clostridiales bacterium]
MELTTIIGLLAGFAAIVISILIDKGGDIASFYNLPAIFITVVGALCSTVVAFPLKTLKSLFSVVKNAFRKKDIDLQRDIEMIISIANVARREGLLALEDAVTEIDSPFFKKGVMLVVDGADPELVKNIMEAEIYFVQDRHSTGQAVLETLGELAPAYGMIGTLIGLINMLKNLSDTDALGPGMAVALITTFYGSLLANLVFIPLAKKLKVQTAEETLEKELLLEGLLSIQDGENPRIIKDKLYSFIARSEIKDTGSTKSDRQETGEIANE